MPPVKFHWFHMLCKIHEKKNVFQVHRVLISLCLQGQEECRAIPTFTLFQISFSLVKIMACQWTGKTNKKLTQNTWQAKMNIYECQKNYVSKILPLGKGGECLIIVFFPYAFYNDKILRQDGIFLLFPVITFFWQVQTLTDRKVSHNSAGWSCAKAFQENWMLCSFPDLLGLIWWSCASGR